MDPNDIPVAGNEDHKAKDEEKWKSIIKKLKLDDCNNAQKEHLDLMTGTGRLIFKVVNQMENKFKYCTGVDYSNDLTKKFREILKQEEYKWCRK